MYPLPLNTPPLRILSDSIQMVSKTAGLSPSAIRNLKLILTVSSSYYARILPLYRKSLEHCRRSGQRVKNPKGLRVKTHRMGCVAATNVSTSTLSSVPRSSVNLTPRVEPAAGLPGDKSRKLKDASAINLTLMPLLRQLQGSLIFPSHIVLRKGRCLLVRQRGPVGLEKFPKDLVTIKIPPGPRRTGRFSKK